MKALFLAGGMGTRMKPLTDDIPKSMVPIMNKPLLERSMMNLIKYGIRDIVLSVGHMSEYIQEYFGDGSKFGLNIEYVFESTPLGTGGAIKSAGHLFTDTFLVMNADILCEIDIADLIGYHSSKAASVTIAVTEVINPTAYGVIEYDKDNTALSFIEKPKLSEIKSNYINAGIYVFEPRVLDEIPAGRSVSIERETFPLLLLKNNKMTVYKGCSYWMDIGTPQKYMQTHEDIMSGKCHLFGVDFDDINIINEGNSIIDNTASITGPVYIGNNVKIGAHAVIGPYAVIGSDVIIRHDASIVGSLLWDHVDIGSHAEAYGSIVASYCHVKRSSISHDIAVTKTASLAC